MPGPQLSRTRAWPEPYRIFFPIGLACGLIGAGVWPLYSFGILTWPGPVHRGLMMPGFETAFVLGFLFTAMPAFTRGPKIRPFELGLAAAAMVMVPVATLAGWNAVPETASLAALLIVIVSLVSRLRGGASAPPEEFRFVGFGLAMGVLGAALRLATALHATLPLPPRFEERLTSLGMVLSLVLGLGGLLVPTFARLPEPLVIPGIAGAHERRGRRELYTVAVAALALAFVLELVRLPRLGAGLRAIAAATMVGLVWKPWRIPRSHTAAAWMLWLSGWMILAGLAGAALVPRYEIGALHAVFLGGFATLTLGVATRVVVLHGRHPLVLENSVLTPAVLAAMLAALTARWVAEAIPAHAYFWLGVSGSLWWLAWGMWAVRAVPALWTRGQRVDLVAGPVARPPERAS